MASEKTNQETHKGKQNDANAALRVAEALRLRRMGFTYDEIARKVGYANRSGAFKAIKGALARIIHQEAQELAVHTTQFQLDRLDFALEKAVMPALEKGDLDAARVLATLLKHQADLLGLYPKPGDMPDKGIKREYVGFDPQQVINGNGYAHEAVSATRGSTDAVPES